VSLRPNVPISATTCRVVGRSGGDLCEGGLRVGTGGWIDGLRECSAGTQMDMP